MTTSETGHARQSNNVNNSFPINENTSPVPFPVETLRFPLDNSMRIVFTGYFNGYCVEVRSVDEMALLYHMGCFGKGSFSRSKPRSAHADGTPVIMRKRQFQKRDYWHKKFGSNQKKSTAADMFLKEIDELSTKIVQDSNKLKRKDVIDLVSSDEEISDNNEEQDDETGALESHYEGDMVVTVPDSDSGDENYFAKLQPKCCLNNVKLEEKLMLTLQEAFFLVYGLGSLQVISMDNKILNIQQCWDLFSHTDKYFVPKYVVFHYFRSKGYVVKPGIKFGGDYLLYKEGPSVAHADYIVVIKLDEDKEEWYSILGRVRMAITTVKEILIAEVTRPERDLNLPEELNCFKVREILLNRNVPDKINTDTE